MKDHKQLKEYYENNRKNLLKKIKGKLNNVSDAEDVVQETFAKALKYWGNYDHNKPLDGWITGILFNSLSEFKREERMHGMPALEEPLFDIEETHAVKDLAHKAIAKVEGRDKDILTLSFVKGYPDKDIGDILGVASHNVRQVLSRFRKRLKILVTNQA